MLKLNVLRMFCHTSSNKINKENRIKLCKTMDKRTEKANQGGVQEGS